MLKNLNSMLDIQDDDLVYFEAEMYGTDLWVTLRFLINETIDLRLCFWLFNPEFGIMNECVEYELSLVTLEEAVPDVERL